MKISTQDALLKLKSARNSPFLELFQDGKISLEIYQPDRIDHQKPHARDEVYFIISGSAQFSHNGETYAVAPGDFIHVPAHEEHRFLDFTDDFSTWVLFYG
jgi:mannose-6-phosphate isomerase-like protein (cupin superfamily)